MRLARGYTSREKIIKFSGCYHGHSDAFLIQAGSGAVTFGSPNSPGVTQGQRRILCWQIIMTLTMLNFLKQMKVKLQSDY